MTTIFLHDGILVSDRLCTPYGYSPYYEETKQGLSSSGAVAVAYAGDAKTKNYLHDLANAIEKLILNDSDLTKGISDLVKDDSGKTVFIMYRNGDAVTMMTHEDDELSSVDRLPIAAGTGQSIYTALYDLHGLRGTIDHPSIMKQVSMLDGYTSVACDCTVGMSLVDLDTLKEEEVNE